MDRAAEDRKFGSGCSRGQGRKRHATGKPAGAGESAVGPVVTTLNKILAAAGVVLLLGGLWLGFRSVSASGTNCGSAFQPAAGITPMDCDGRLERSATLVAIVVGLGVLCVAGSVVVKVVRDRAKQRVAL